MRKPDYHKALVSLGIMSNRTCYTTEDFNRLCKIPMSNGLKEAYCKVGILSIPNKGTIYINSDNINMTNIVKAHDLVRERRRKYRDSSNKIKAYNLEHEVKVTPEICIEYLRKHGYFIYKPEKHDVIKVCKEFKF